MFRRFHQRLTGFLRRWSDCLQAGRRRTQERATATAPDLTSAGNQERISREATVARLNQTLARSGDHFSDRSSVLRAAKARNQATNDKATNDNTQSPSHLDQPDLIKTLADSAYVCERQGRFGEAERLYKQVLTLGIRRFGEMHLEIAPHLADLSKLYCLQKRYVEALPLLSSALKIRQQSQVAHHPDIGEVCTQLADVHRHLQQYKAAESLLQSALEVFREAYGPQHTRTKLAHSDLMQLIAIAIESGKFDQISDEPPPLDLETLGETHSWAVPSWMKSKEIIEEDYSWIKLFEKEKGR